MKAISHLSVCKYTISMYQITVPQIIICFCAQSRSGQWLNSISGTHCTCKGNTKKRRGNGNGQSIRYCMSNTKNLGWRTEKGLIAVWQRELEWLEFDMGESMCWRDLKQWLWPARGMCLVRIVLCDGEVVIWTSGGPKRSRWWWVAKQVQSFWCEVWSETEKS